jgi:hypothetical protein
MTCLVVFQSNTIQGKEVSKESQFLTNVFYTCKELNKLPSEILQEDFILLSLYQAFLKNVREAEERERQKQEAKQSQSY